MKLIAIYTAITGKYERIKQPSVIDEHFDYILFSNDLFEKQIGVWQVRPIPYHHSNQIMVARYVKTHPEELLGTYQATVWVDANICLIDNYIYSKTLNLFETNILVAACPHPATDDVYEHIYEMMQFRFIHDSCGIKTMQYLLRHQYPRHAGLCETGILYRVICDEIKRVDESWWALICDLCYRDQFTFNYILWSRSIKNGLLLPLDEPIKNTSHLRYPPHHDCKNKFITPIGFELLRYRIRSLFGPIYPKYVDQYVSISQKKHPLIMLFVWGVLQAPTYIIPYIFHRIHKICSKF